MIHARIPIERDLLGSKGGIISVGKFTPGDGNYRGRRFEIREEDVRE